MAELATQGERKVLVVDDDEDLLALACRQLDRHGFSTLSATSGEDALRILSSETGIDLVVLDYRLPGRNGVETLLEIRRGGGGPSVVLATGVGSEEVATDALRGGALDYLRKGADYLTRLPEAVERAWQMHDLRQRSAELQRLALLVTSAEDRQAVLDEIVEGAHRLLRCEGCALFVLTNGHVRMQAVAGRPPIDPEALAREVSHRVADGGRAVVDVDRGRLYVPLASPDGPAQGVLVVLSPHAHPADPEEIKLAETFGSFAGIAITNLRRLELEREMVAQLEGLVEARRRFVTSVSHELRTPLTCIQGFSSTLVNHGDNLSPAERIECAHMVHRHATDLAELLEQLLAAARVEVGRLSVQLEPLDLEAEVSSVTQLLAPLFEGRELSLTLEDVSVLADAQLLRRTLTNLLSNAVKYSAPGSPVAVRSRATGAVVSLEVEDHGRGMAPDEIMHAFEPFWRSPDDQGTVRGTGLGLSLVREYVSAMGGEIRVTSEPGRGSVFTLVLQREGAPADSG